MATDAPQLEPVLGGSSLTFVTLPPTPAGAPPGWHRTETLDYNILLGGELVLMVDEGEMKLYPGDVVIQRNTKHCQAILDSRLHTVPFLDSCDRSEREQCRSFSA